MEKLIKNNILLTKILVSHLFPCCYKIDLGSKKWKDFIINHEF